MTEDNKELLGRLARRLPEPPEEPVVPVVPTAEWNAPIDVTQADCMTALGIIRGQVAAAKEIARRWVPRPYPGR